MKLKMLFQRFLEEIDLAKIDYNRVKISEEEAIAIAQKIAVESRWAWDDGTSAFVSSHWGRMVWIIYVSVTHVYIVLDAETGELVEKYLSPVRKNKEVLAREIYPRLWHGPLNLLQVLQPSPRGEQ